MDFINNENGTYTIRWEEYSNGKDLTSWGGEETGKIEEVTIKPEELCYIDIDHNTIYFTGSVFIYNICPSNIIILANKFKELLPNLLEVQADIFESRKVGNYRINPDNISFYLKGTASVPDKIGLLKMGNILFHWTTNLILNDLECTYFERVYLPLRETNIAKIKEKLNNKKN